MGLFDYISSCTAVFSTVSIRDIEFFDGHVRITNDIGKAVFITARTLNLILAKRAAYQEQEMIIRCSPIETVRELGEDIRG